MYVFAELINKLFPAKLNVIHVFRPPANKASSVTCDVVTVNR